MRSLSTLVSALAIGTASLAVALPQASMNGLPTGYQWQVENWQTGCTDAECTYNFNVSGSINGIYPGFTAYCNGPDSGYYKDCQFLKGMSTSGIPKIAAGLRPNAQDGVAIMAVSLRFTDASSAITYDVSGVYDAAYNDFASSANNFVITPDGLNAVS